MPQTVKNSIIRYVSSNRSTWSAAKHSRRPDESLTKEKMLDYVRIGEVRCGLWKAHVSAEDVTSRYDYVEEMNADTGDISPSRVKPK